MKQLLSSLFHQFIVASSRLISELANLTNEQLEALHRLADLVVKEIVNDLTQQEVSTKDTENQNLVEGVGNERQS